MIVYKAVVKKDGKYCSLMNYGIESGRKYKCKKYHKNKLIKDPKIFNRTKTEHLNQNILNRFEGCWGYHFYKIKKPNIQNLSWCAYSKNWKRIKGNVYDRWEKYLNKVNNTNNIKITVVKCEIKEKDIMKQDDLRLIASKFKILEEV